MLHLLLACTDGDPSTDVDRDGWAAPADCDDADASVHPEAGERCDGRDEDCDGIVDEEPLDAQPWFLDFDADGYGGEPWITCTPDATLVGVGGDCADTIASVHPGADEVCDEVDQDCDGFVDEWPVDGYAYALDEDGDGWGSAVVQACREPDGAGTEGDCDDADPSRFPGASEVCNLRDDDCDGEIDEDAIDPSTWFEDADADGYGGPASVRACDPPAGWVEDGTDCDDTDPEVTPAGVERCGGGDEDCDGTVDEPDAADAPSWYPDGDGDRFGDGAAIRACEGAAGWAAWSGDCDDTAAEVNPAAVEACDATVDTNCDGSYGDMDADGDGAVACEDCDDADASWSDPATWYLDADGDGFGDDTQPDVACWPLTGFVADATDCEDTRADTWPGAPEVWYDGFDEACDGGSDFDADRDGYDAEVGGAPDCDDGESAVHPGAVEVCNDGVDNDCDGEAPGCAPEGTYDIADAWARIVGEDDYDLLGSAAADAGDVDGSGHSALLLGARAGNAEPGTTYLLTDVQVGGGVAASFAAVTIEGENLADHFGGAVDGLGDADGDGTFEFVVGAHGEATMGRLAGAAYLFDVPSNGTYDASTAKAKILAEAASEYLAVRVSTAGDLDGDGVGEVLLYGQEPAFQGRVSIFSSSTTGTVSVTSAPTSIEGQVGGDFLGMGLDGGHDLDGDGVPDFALGAPGSWEGAEDGGAVYLYQHLPSGVVGPSDSDVSIIGEDAGGFLGYSVSIAGDVDGDGYRDVVAGQAWLGTYVTDGGAVRLFLGPLTGRVSSGAADATIYSSEADEALGADVETGDVNLDGYADVLATAQDGARRTGGRAIVAYGPLSGSMVIEDADLILAPEDTNYGTPLARLASDFDGDGYPDLLFTRPDVDDDGYRRGAAYIWLGGGF